MSDGGTTSTPASSLPLTRQELRAYLLDHLPPTFEPNLDRFLDAVWPVYDAMRAQIPLPTEDGSSGE